MSKEAVRNIDPAAYAMPTHVLESFPVRVATWSVMSYKGETLGQGNTEDMAWQAAAIQIDAPAVSPREAIVKLVMQGCDSRKLDPGDNYNGAKQNRPNALKEHVESEVDYMLSRFRAQPTR